MAPTSSDLGDEWQSAAMQVLASVMDSDLAQTYFNDPVDADALGIPEYNDVVTNPMELSTVKAKLARGEYESPHDVVKDVSLVWSNCHLFNTPGSDVSIACHAVESTFTTLWSGAGLSQWGKGSKQAASAKGKGGKGKNALAVKKKIVKKRAPVAPSRAKGAKGSGGKHAGKTKKKPALKQPSMSNCLKLVKQLMKFPSCEHFLEPVDPEALGIPDYLDVIERPMDLGTIHETLMSAKVIGWSNINYRTPLDFRKDVEQVWWNCRRYNDQPEDYWIIQMCEECEQEFTKLWRELGFEAYYTSLEEREREEREEREREAAEAEEAEESEDVDGAADDQDDAEYEQDDDEEETDVGEGDEGEETPIEPKKKQGAKGAAGKGLGSGAKKAKAGDGTPNKKKRKLPETGDTNDAKKAKGEGGEGLAKAKTKAKAKKPAQQKGVGGGAGGGGGVYEPEEEMICLTDDQVKEMFDLNAKPNSRCPVCKVQKKGSCGTETAPQRCYRRQEKGLPFTPLTFEDMRKFAHMVMRAKRRPSHAPKHKKSKREIRAEQLNRQMNAKRAEAERAKSKHELAIRKYERLRSAVMALEAAEDSIEMKEREAYQAREKVTNFVPENHTLSPLCIPDAVMHIGNVFWSLTPQVSL